ncbi:ATP-binding protein [Denitratisoma sp. agr-D3]
MRFRLDSLYLRLALVLAVALLAGFFTVGWLFHHHMEQDRARGVRHGLAEQARLIESFLARHPDDALPESDDLNLYRGEAPPDTEPGTPFFSPPDLASRLEEDLGRPVTLRHGVKEDSLWLRLALPIPTWWRLPLPPRHDGPPRFGEGPGMMPGAPPGPPGRRGVEPWTWGLLVSFAVVFVGGMALLWRVQVPLRQLEQALDKITPNATPVPLELHGPGEVKRLAERFNRMMARLHQHEQDREVMLAGVAHDLRAPVTRLRLQLELENSPRQQDMLRNLSSMEAIVDQFLLYARGGEAEAKTEWELNAFLAEVAAPYEDQGVSCHTEATDTILPIQASSLRRALCNLIENALEYGATPVEVSLLQDNERIMLRVRDHGAGIAAADQARALRPFTRLDESRGRQGHCGLGLSIANRIAESHGGHLVLEAAPGGGLQASIVLPRTA